MVRYVIQHHSQRLEKKKNMRSRATIIVTTCAMIMKKNVLLNSDYSPFHKIFEIWSVFFRLGLTRPRCLSSAKALWNNALELLVAYYETMQIVAYLVLGSFSSIPSPAIALKADHKSLTLMSVPDSKYI